jgi:hypothetical protein
MMALILSNDISNGSDLVNLFDRLKLEPGVPRRKRISLSGDLTN